jgi:hypothetical protein
MSPNFDPAPNRGLGLPAWCLASAIAALVLSAPALHASDHADPIDPFNRERLEGGITDLFVFPILQDGRAAFPFKRTDGISIASPDLSMRPSVTTDQQGQIKGLAVILCVRRALTESGSLNLAPYTYRIHMDLHSRVSFENTEGDEVRESDHGHDHPEGGGGYTPPPAAGAKGPKRPTGAEARARYGGTIADPAKISSDVLIEFTLKNDAKLNEIRVVRGLKDAVAISIDKADPGQISAWAGVRDDPFIFPAFFGTNVVAMVLTIPISAFPTNQQDWLIWGTSHRGSRQVDHVGRSLRTQNPRFELLNTLPPDKHVAAILKEHEHPSLPRDIALRFNFQSLFAYRMWDFVPDVMIYTNRFPVGFPNGRLPTDDVAALLAQHGDTLLLELSHQTGGWPRRTTNDKPFNATFPYLADPWPDHPAAPPPMLSSSSWMKIAGIAIAVVLLFALENWVFAIWYHRWKLRRRYL